MKNLRNGIGCLELPKITSIHEATKINSNLFSPIEVTAFKAIRDARSFGWEEEKNIARAIDNEATFTVKIVHVELLTTVIRNPWNAQKIYDSWVSSKRCSCVTAKSTVQSTEKKIQRKLVSLSQGKAEVRTPIGVIDVLTKKSIIEIKVSSEWKHGLGQLLAYATYYPVDILTALKVR